jgi:hypothetical protein
MKAKHPPMKVNGEGTFTLATKGLSLIDFYNQIGKLLQSGDYDNLLVVVNGMEAEQDVKLLSAQLGFWNTDPTSASRQFIEQYNIEDETGVVDGYPITAIKFEGHTL